MQSYVYTQHFIFHYNFLLIFIPLPQINATTS